MNSPAPAPPKATAGRTLDRQSLYQRIYPLRTLGMALGIVPVAIVFLELRAGSLAWAWLLACGVVWPHLAHVLAGRSAAPYRAEQRNLVMDSIIVGSLLPLMHFNLLPTVMLVTVNFADKFASGVRGLWSRALIGMAVGLLASGMAYGWRPDIHSSTAVVLACLPLLVIHTLASSATSHFWIRKVQASNAKLDEMQRRDSLTGLESRHHWEAVAATVLERHRDGQPACLLLLDADHFKQINDRYGHACGDDVLRSIAQCLIAALPAGSHAGRLGGDEFVAVLPMSLAQAQDVADDIRQRVAKASLPDVPELRYSISLGLASPPSPTATLRAWLEAADRALYRAKAHGRDRIQISDG
ncbi:MAG TPA: diguanylate cyclase [Chiayiivirga sp.]|nr:diguanylate cyclase [Chiayiivirga sp.]